MEGWPEAKVRDGRAAIEIKPAPTKKLEPITARIRKAVPLGRNKHFIALGFQDDGKTLLGYTDLGGAVMDLELGRLDVRIPWAADPSIVRVVLSADKKTVFVRRNDVRKEQIVKNGKTTTIFHPTGRLDAYDVSTGRKLPVFDGRAPSSGFEIVASSDGQWLAFNERSKVSDATSLPYETHLWDLTANKSVVIGNEYVGELYFTADSKLLVAVIYGVKGAKSQVMFWDVPNPTPRVVAVADDAFFWGPWFSYDRKWILFRRRPKDPQKPLELELQRRADGAVLWKGTQRGEGQLYAELDPKSRLAAILDVTDGLRFLDLTSLKVTKAFDLPKDVLLFTPSFSPDGTRFAVISQELRAGSARSTDPESFEQPILWLVDVSRPMHPERVVLPPNRSWRFWWTPDGKSVVIQGIGRHLVLDATNVNGRTAKP